MKYIGALVISTMLFLGLIGPSLSIDFWHKLLYNKSTAKAKKKKDFRVVMIIWIALTLALFVFVALFVND